MGFWKWVIGNGKIIFERMAQRVVKVSRQEQHTLRRFPWNGASAAVLRRGDRMCIRAKKEVGRKNAQTFMQIPHSLQADNH